MGAGETADVKYPMFEFIGGRTWDEKEALMYEHLRSGGTIDSDDDSDFF